MTTKKRMFGNLITSKLMKVISIMVVTCMLFALTGCGGNVSQQDARQRTTEYETEKPEGDPGSNHDDGYRNDEESSPTEEHASTEEPSSDSTQSGTHTYDVDGVQITLKTNVDEFISINAAGNGIVRLNDIAATLEMEYWGTMGDGSPMPLNDQCRYFYDSNGDGCINMDDICVGLWVTGQDAGEIYYEYPNTGNDISVKFARNDVDNDSIMSYYIQNDPDAPAKKRINYEQIIVFTFLLENARYAPQENWMKDSGFVLNGASYYINK